MDGSHYSNNVDAQVSFDPSNLSVESFDPLSGLNEEFDPSDDEDERKNGSGSESSENSFFLNGGTEKNHSKKKKAADEILTLRLSLLAEQVIQPNGSFFQTLNSLSSGQKRCAQSNAERLIQRTGCFKSCTSTKPGRRVGRRDISRGGAEQTTRGDAACQHRRTGEVYPLGCLGQLFACIIASRSSLPASPLPAGRTRCACHQTCRVGVHAIVRARARVCPCLRACVRVCMCVRVCRENVDLLTRTLAFLRRLPPRAAASSASGQVPFRRRRRRRCCRCCCRRRHAFVH